MKHGDTQAGFISHSVPNVSLGSLGNQHFDGGGVGCGGGGGVCKIMLMGENVPKTVMEGPPGGDGRLDCAQEPPFPLWKCSCPQIQAWCKTKLPIALLRSQSEFLSIFEENKEEITHIRVGMNEAHQQSHSPCLRDHSHHTEHPLIPQIDRTGSHPSSQGLA